MKRHKAPALASLLLLLPLGCAHYLDRIPSAPAPTAAGEVDQVDLPRDAVRAFIESRHSIYQGDLLGALQHLRAASAHDDSSPALRTRLAEAYLQLGQLDDAMRLCRQALKLDGGHCPAHHMLGRVASYRGDLDVGDEALRRALECDPDQDDAWRDLNFLLRAQGRFEEQLELLDRMGNHTADEGWLLRHRGETLKTLGRSDEAMEALRAAVEVDPEDEESLAIVLGAYADAKRPELAVAFLEDLVYRYPSSMQLREHLARTYAAAGRYDDVIGQYMSEYEQDPDNRDLYAVHAADWLERLLRFAEAEELLVATAAEFPDSSMIWLKLGWIREAAGDLEGAERAWSEVERDDPYGTIALRERARVLVAAERTEEAAELLAQAVAANADSGLPPQLDIHVDLIQLRADEGDFLGARQALAPLRAEDPDLHTRQLGWLHWKMGEIAQAELILGEAIQGEGVQPAASLLLADIYRREGLYELGAEVLEAALARLDGPSAAQMLPRGRYPTDSLQKTQIRSYQVDVLAHLAFLLGLAGEQDRALTTMHRVLQLDRDDIRALNFIGYTYAEQNRELELAEDYVREALTLQPLDPAVMDSLGWVLYRQGRLDEALDALEQARQRMPDSAVIWHHLGVVYLDLDRTGDARESLERCLETVDPVDPESVGSADRARELLDELDAGGTP